jgi:hypothetical protein
MHKICGYLLASFTILSALSGCGTGGGGGGESNGSSTGVRVLHAVIDAAPVDVSTVGGTQVISEGNRFAVANPYQDAPRGEQVLTIVRAKTPSSVITTIPASITSESRLSVLFYGDSSKGLQRKLFNDQFPESFTGSLIRVVHGATGAAAVRVAISSSAGGSAAGNATFGEATDYLSVPAGVATITSSRVADNRAINSVAIPIEEGKAYTLLLAGEVDYYVKGVVYSDN